MVRRFIFPFGFPILVCVVTLALGGGWASGLQASNGDSPDPGSSSTSSSWWLRLQTTAYTFQTSDRAEVEEDRFGAYQHFDGAIRSLWNGRLSLRAAGRLADDFQLDRKVHDRERLYTGYAEARLDPASLRARLGRQFVQEGSVNLTLDGLHLKLQPAQKIDLRLWAGARAPLSKEYEAGDIDEDPTWGAHVIWRAMRRARLGLFAAYRERDGQIAARPAGFELHLTPIDGLRAIGRGSYDLESEEWNRKELFAQYRPRPDLPIFSLQLLDRLPAIDASSYFARFDNLERITVARGSARYQNSEGLGAEIEYFGAFVDDRNSSRIGGAILSRFARVGYSIKTGDTGEESRFYGDLNYRPLGWLRLEGGAAISTYALLEDAPESEERDLTSAFARVRADLRPGLRLTLEAQSLDNPFYSEDVRFLAGLDLFLGGGKSRVGLGTGGWLQ